MHCLLELGRAQRAPLRTEDIDLSALCDRLRSDLPEGPRRGAIAWKISRGLRVRGCPAQVALLMRNLLANAAKYTRETVHPVVAISAGVHDITVVEDNGVGFDDAHASRLFHPSCACMPAAASKARGSACRSRAASSSGMAAGYARAARWAPARASSSRWARGSMPAS